jgi:hypothetical protein
VLPSVFALPCATAGQGDTSLSWTLENPGDAAITSLRWKLSGDAAFSLVEAPEQIPAHGSALLRIDYRAASHSALATALLQVESPRGVIEAPVYAASADANIGAAVWRSVTGPGGAIIGEEAIITLPTAPYPFGDSKFTDASVYFFLPEGYRQLAAQNVVLHFHGHRTTLAETLPKHLYAQHLYASGVNALLVVPQGPVNKASGDFGKLMNPLSTRDFLEEALATLYREKKISAPVLGEVILTGHSGGYKAIAANLLENTWFAVAQVHLYDALYGSQPEFSDYAVNGGVLRSNYTPRGGTLAKNQAFAADLVSRGVSVSIQDGPRSWRDRPVVVSFADASHKDATRLRGAYGEHLRWSGLPSRRGPRVELRQAIAEKNEAVIRWFSPHEAGLSGFSVETSSDGTKWDIETTTGPEAEEARFALAGPRWVRVLPRVEGIDKTLSSDACFVDAEGRGWVVNGFERRVGGSLPTLSQDVAARVGRAWGASGCVSRWALTEDAVSLEHTPRVLWLAGETGPGDGAVLADEQAILSAYVQAGGALVLSGSKAAADLSARSPDFLADVFGVSLLSDESASQRVRGASGESWGVTENPGYAAASFDGLSALPGAEARLWYKGGIPAAVGRFYLHGSALLVGFPVEFFARELWASLGRELGW